MAYFQSSTATQVVLEDGRAYYLGAGVQEVLEADVVEFLKAHPGIQEVEAPKPSGQADLEL